MTSATIGTPTYMSPEQIKNSQLSPASDIYSLAVMVYEMLVGSPPFTGDTATVMLAHIQQQPNLRLIPPALRPVLKRALDKKPAHRFRTAMDFAKAFTQAVHGSNRAGMNTPRPNRLTNSPASGMWLWVGGGILIVLFLVFVLEPGNLSSTQPNSKNNSSFGVTPTETPTVEPTFTPPPPPPPTATPLPTIPVLNTSSPATSTPVSPRNTPTATINQNRQLALNTTGYQWLASHLSNPPVSASFSPDGGKIAVMEGVRLYIVNVDGSNHQVLMEESDAMRPVSDAVWSPDGQLIAFVADYKTMLCRMAGIAVPTHNTYRLLDECAAGISLGAPRWTQDGRLLVNRYPGEPADGVTYVYNQSGQGQPAVGSYVLSSSHEGQKWFPWQPGRTWQVGSSDRPDSYYRD